MRPSHFSRREFQKLSLAALSGALVGTGLTNQARADKKDPKKDPFLEEPHICRGLNTCKNLGQDKKNACAGQGVCATAKAHDCSAENDCRGQGGCGEKPGQNACKSKGECAVPLKDASWKKARARFEEVMKKAGKKVGPAPKKK